MNNVFRSPIDIKRIGSLYHSVCVSCGAFVAASPSLGCLKIAARQHQCRERQLAKAAGGNEAIPRRVSTAKLYAPES
jgi:hypothetical protein